jgi:hypothetical protein
MAVINIKEKTRDKLRAKKLNLSAEKSQNVTYDEFFDKLISDSEELKKIKSDDKAKK